MNTGPNCVVSENIKTIFISSFFGLISRNILSTDVLKILKSEDKLRIVVLVPPSKKDLYQKIYRGDNIFFESIESKKKKLMETYLTSIFLNSSDTSSRKIHRIIERKKHGKYCITMFYWILSKLSHLKIFRYLLRYFYSIFWTSNSEISHCFDLYSPDAVFSTDIFESSDIDLIIEAKKRNIPIIGMIRSWDNITTKGLNMVIPDKLIVNTPQIKEEAIKYCDFNQKDIFVVGIPHYDAYVTEQRKSKEKLFEELNLDPNKKTVFFAPPSDIYTQGDPVASKIIKTLLSENLQLIIRLYIVGKIDLGEIIPIQNKIAIDDPGSGINFNNADLTGKDSHLADLLYHSDVIIAFASTLAIDAIVFNKPIIFVGFDGEENRSYWKSLKRFYDYDHQRSTLKLGGIKLAKSPEELIKYTKDYLYNPNIDKEGRERILFERCWKLDGKSGERLANVLLKFIELK
jgi:hypothetical protein